jgi:hypothetical protein
MAVFFDASPDVLTPEVLAGLGDDQLWQVIYDNLHPGKDTPGAWEALVAPEVVDRVRRLLTARHVDIEHQLAERGAELAEFRHQCWEAGPAGRQAWFDREAEHNRWRGRALDVKRSIAYRLQVAKATAGAMGQQRVAQERRAYRGAACRLAVAINRHRQAGVQEGIDPEPHDQALWEVLREVRVPQGSELVAAADLLADGVWPCMLRGCGCCWIQTSSPPGPWTDDTSACSSASTLPAVP